MSSVLGSSTGCPPFHSFSAHQSNSQKLEKGEDTKLDQFIYLLAVLVSSLMVESWKSSTVKPKASLQELFIWILLAPPLCARGCLLRWDGGHARSISGPQDDVPKKGTSAEWAPESQKLKVHRGKTEHGRCRWQTKGPRSRGTRNVGSVPAPCPAPLHICFCSEQDTHAYLFVFPNNAVFKNLAVQHVTKIFKSWHQKLLFKGKYYFRVTLFF